MTPTGIRTPFPQSEPLFITPIYMCMCICVWAQFEYGKLGIEMAVTFCVFSKDSTNNSRKIFRMVRLSKEWYGANIILSLIFFHPDENTYRGPFKGLPVMSILDFIITLSGLLLDFRFLLVSTETQTKKYSVSISPYRNSSLQPILDQRRMI